MSTALTQSFLLAHLTYSQLELVLGNALCASRSPKVQSLDTSVSELGNGAGFSSVPATSGAFAELQILKIEERAGLS